MSEQKISIINESVFLAAIPVIGYWLAYLYQLGQMTYFDIPSMYVEININSVISAIAALLVVLMVFYILLESVYVLFIGRLPRILKYSIFEALFMILFYWSCAIIFKWTLTKAIVFGLPIVGVFIFTNFFLPLFSHKDVKGYVAKLEAQNNRDKDTPRIIKVLGDKIGQLGRYSLVLFYLLSYFAYFSGGYVASISSEFTIIKQTPELVVLKKYAENYIAADFDRKTNKVYSKYKLIPINQPGLEIAYENIGQLTPSKTINSSN